MARSKGAAKPEYTEAYLNGIIDLIKEPAKKERFKVAATRIERLKAEALRGMPLSEPAKQSIFAQLISPAGEYLDVRPGFHFHCENAVDFASHALLMWMDQWYIDEANRARRKNRP